MLTVKVGFSPLDEQLELGEGHWSEGLVREAVWLSGLVPYEQVQMVLERLGGVGVSKSSIWRRVQCWGSRMGGILEAERERANALPAKWEPSRSGEEGRGRMGAAMDGAMVHIREEGWKELKIGCVFEVEVEKERATDMKEPTEVAHAVQNSYVAHLGGPGVLGELLWAEARRREWPRTVDRQTIGDGAPWIWNLVALHFSDSHQLVDWYHAKQHLVAASRYLKGEGTPAATRWLHAQETRLYQGHAAAIALELAEAATDHPTAAAELAREATYFRSNQGRMNYMEMREAEWPIGSGMIESGAKQFKTRFTGPGMRWSRPGAQNLLPVRAIVLSDRFDEVWRKAYYSPPN